MNEELQTAAEHLHAYGYCVLKDRIPREAALALGRRCLALHSDPRCLDYIVGDEYYQTLFGMLNQDDEVWSCAFHPDPVALARHFWGPRCRVVEACSKPTWPGAPTQHLHADSAGSFAQVPDVPWMINSIWMLTDFTAANGATGVVPMSHRSRRPSSPPDMEADSPLIKPVEGRAGSVMLWHGGLFHQARANQSEDVRIGLNIAYYPPWFNNWIEGGHQPLWPETYERMPDDFRRLCPGLLGRRRADRYERR